MSMPRSNVGVGPRIPRGKGRWSHAGGAPAGRNPVWKRDPTAEGISLQHDFARALNPCLLARDCGLVPDAIQERVLLSDSKKLLLNCCRQWGKSTTAALAALHESLYRAPALIVLISPSMSQSTELFKKLQAFWANLRGAPRAENETLTRLTLENGSRIVSLPGSEKTTRGYSAAGLVIMDEASRVPDELLAVVRPMLATTNGRFIAMTTPAGKRGWFYEAWLRGEGFERIEVAAKDCPRISKEFLADELKSLGPLVYEQEYCCAFHDPETSAFSSELIEAALVSDFEPFLEGRAMVS